MSESSKTTELKITIPFIEAGIDMLKDFVTRVFGSTADELGSMMSDTLKVRRLGNIFKNVEKVRRLAKKHNVKVKPATLKALYSYLEGVSLEEDPILQDMWANLFLNYIDTDANLSTIVYLMSGTSRPEGAQ